MVRDAMESRDCHKVLKLGCRAEASALLTAERLTNLIAVFCILSWSIFWMTMMNHMAPDARVPIARTSVEARVLYLLIGMGEKHDDQQQPLSRYLTKIARLGATSPARRPFRPAIPSSGVASAD